MTKVLGDGEDAKRSPCAMPISPAQTGPGVLFATKPRAFSPEREELLAKLGGKPVPGQGGLHLAKGTGSEYCLLFFHMAATKDRIWLAVPPGANTAFGIAMLYRPSLDATERLADVQDAIYCVAAVEDAVFFGSVRDGLYKVDGNGRLLKHYSPKDSPFPLTRITGFSQGGGNLYMCYCNAPRYGVAVLNPASDSLTILAPTSREANQRTEPCGRRRARVVGCRRRAALCQLP